MAHLLRRVLLAATVVAPAASAASFGYEGRLDDLGSPANGRYDLELRAYADARGPSMLAAPITFADVAVAQGRFRLDFDLPLAPRGTAFQRDVWTALCDIPYGETISYSELAQRIGRPRAVRAVGLANGANPLSIIVPCHRVIGANGSLTGYGGGLNAKRWLLDLEQRRNPSAPFALKSAQVN